MDRFLCVFNAKKAFDNMKDHLEGVYSDKKKIKNLNFSKRLKEEATFLPTIKSFIK